MGQDILLEFETPPRARLRPKVVTTSSPSSRKVHDGDRKAQSTSKYHHLKRTDGDMRELGRSYSSNLHYESMHARTFGADGDNAMLKRGSMYQSSEDVRRMRKLREGRRKVESRCNEDAFLSFDIIERLPEHDMNKANQLQHQKVLPLVRSSSDSEPTSAETSNSITTSSTDFLDLSFRELPDKPLDNSNSFLDCLPAKDSLVDDYLEVCLHSANQRSPCIRAAPGLLEVQPLKEKKSDSCEKISPEVCRKPTCESDSVNSLPKCFSESAKMSHSVSQLKYGLAEARSSKTMFSPLKKMFDPIMKSKSVRDSSLMETQSSGYVVVDPTNTGGNAVLQKSLQNEVPMMEENMKNDACSTRGELLVTSALSPAHLHGSLKLNVVNGNLSFEFSLQDPDEVLSAKTWKTDNAFNWIYTFHIPKKKNNTSRVTRDKHGQSAQLVGQMQVSCYLCSEVRENRSLANSTVTEFVLYDIGRARRSFASEQRSKLSSDSTQTLSSNSMEDMVTSEPLTKNHLTECPESTRLGFSSCGSEASTSYPWSPEDLHPQHEIAATVIQIPFNKKESSKENQSVSRSPAIDPGKENIKILNPAIVNVVTPSGNHGLPNTNEGGPSSLLDRWRCGGGCDCGGWDMACPLNVLDNHHVGDWIDHSNWELHKPMLLFVQGSKEKVPAISIMADGKGQYSVDFHAQFSVLQAFSICIAVLHASEVSSAVVQEKSRHRLYSNSQLRLLLEEEVRHLIEAVGTEEQRKAKEGVEQMPPSFFLDPPFSPIGRV